MKSFFKSFLNRFGLEDKWQNLFKQGCEFFQAGEINAAIEKFQQALDELSPRMKWQDDPKKFSTLVCLASCLKQVNNFEEAEKCLLEALEIYSSGSKLSLEDVAFAYKELAICFYESGQFNKSTAPIQQAISIYQSNPIKYKNELGESKFFSARTLISLSLFDEAEILLKDCVDIFVRESNSETDVCVLYLEALTYQALIWNRKNEYLRAEENLKLAISLYENYCANGSIEVARCTKQLADTLLLQARASEAEELYRDAIKMLKRLNLDHLIDYADTVAGLASSYRLQKKFEHAYKFYAEVLLLYEKYYSGEHEDLAMTYTDMAVCLFEQNQLDKAENYFAKACQVLERTMGPENPSLADALFNLANAFSIQNKFQNAIDLYKKSLEISENNFGPESTEIVQKLSGLAYCLQMQEKYAEALPYYKRALLICENQNELQNDEITNVLVGLGNCFMELGQSWAAKPLYEKVLLLKENEFSPCDQELLTRIEVILGELNKSTIS